MMRWLSVVVALVQGTGFAPFDVDALSIAPPTPIVEIQRKVLHGEPSRLAWAPDGSTLYLQSRDASALPRALTTFSFASGTTGCRSSMRSPTGRPTTGTTRSPRLRRECHGSRST